MTSNTRRMARLLDDAFSYTGPTWRMGFDAHVRAWRRHVGNECFHNYHASPAFAAAHDARRDELRAMWPPAWKPAALEALSMENRNVG